MEWTIIIQIFLSFIQQILGKSEKELKEELPNIIHDINIIQRVKYSNALGVLKRRLEETLKILKGEKKNIDFDRIFELMYTLQGILESNFEDFSYINREQNLNLGLDKLNSLKKVILPREFFNPNRFKSGAFKFEYTYPLIGEVNIGGNFKKGVPCALKKLYYGNKIIGADGLITAKGGDFDYHQIFNLVYNYWSRSWKLKSIAPTMLCDIFPLLYYKWKISWFWNQKDPFKIILFDKKTNSLNLKIVVPCEWYSNKLKNGQYNINTKIFLVQINYNTLDRDGVHGKVISEPFNIYATKKKLIKLFKYTY